MEKKQISEIKLKIKPGQANPAPPIGPALGQKGLNIQDFCKQFNDRTKGKDSTMPLPVIIMAKANRTFTFIVKEPPVSSLILKYSGTSKGSSTPGRDSAGQIKVSDVSQIAQIKLSEMVGADLTAAEKMVTGTAKSMGIEVVK